LSWHLALHFCQGWMAIGAASASAFVATLVSDIVRAKSEESKPRDSSSDIPELCVKWVVVSICTLVYSHTMYLHEWRSKLAIVKFLKQRMVLLAFRC
jgi:hypothetical protein